MKGQSPSRLIDARIKELGDWRGTMLGRLRAVIKQADPGKWMQATPNGSVAAYNWTRPLVEQALQAQESGQPVKTPPIPTSPPGA